MDKGQSGAKKIVDNQGETVTSEFIKEERKFVEDNYKEVDKLFKNKSLKRILDKLEEMLDKRDIKISNVPLQMTKEQICTMQGELTGIKASLKFIGGYKQYSDKIKKEMDIANSKANQEVK